MQFALIDHAEGNAGTPSGEVFAEVLSLVEAAEEIGLTAVWFAEHHFGVHHGHLPAPPLLALAAGQRTHRIAVGSAIICLNLHHPLAIAEQIATVDVLTGGRASFGFGSGCTPPEAAAFGLNLTDTVRRERFAEALDIVLGLWRGTPFAFEGRYFRLPTVTLRPVPLGDLRARTWAAANSVESAALVAKRGLGLMTSRDRALDHVQEIVAAYRRVWSQAGWPEPPPVSGGFGLYIDADDRSAEAAATTPVQKLWARAAPRPRWSTTPPPASTAEAAQRVGLLYGSPETVAQGIVARQRILSLTHAHVQLRWPGINSTQARDCLHRLGREVIPRVQAAATDDATNAAP